jgi:tRNA/rRNA methyltransferase
MAVDPLKNIRVVLCETAHPGNIGAAARAMKTMGLAHLALVAPHRYPDPQAEWLAVGAADLLRRARVYERLDEALAGSAFTVACTARPREVAVDMVDARTAAARMVEVARSQPVTLLFGNETAGLTQAEVSKCQLLATIPADPKFSSLNVAAAVQVLAYELRLAAVGATVRGYSGKAPEYATFDEIERFYEHLQASLLESGFLNPRSPKKLMERLRRLFGRTQLEQEEINILRGVIKTLAHPKKKR